MKKIPWMALLCALTACQSAGTFQHDSPEARQTMAYFNELDDTLCTAAARFFLDGLEAQFHYEGPAIERYDTLFGYLHALHAEDPWNDEGAVSHFYEDLESRFGPLTRSDGSPVPDRSVMTAGSMISHIRQAVTAWQEAPWRDSVDFDRFCRYILPYKAGEEPPEDFRAFYRERYAHVRDTTLSLFFTTKAIVCNMLDTLAVFSSPTFWKYPFDLPVSRIEQGRRGSCRQLVNYVASVLRANGIPTAVDFVDTWGNRSGGHLWNVLLMPGDSIYPFEAPSTSYFPPMQFAYKPSKVFRRSYRTEPPQQMPPAGQVPVSLLHLNATDVTHQYVKAFDVSVPVRHRYKETQRYRYGVIAVFDNREWKAAWWGDVRKGNMHFGNMASDVLYMGCWWVKGRLLPATHPFILHTDGRIEEICMQEDVRQDMRLLRKYPLFKRVSGYMGYVKWSQVEVSDHADFRDTVRLFVADFVPDGYKDTVIVRPPQPHRYVRWHSNFNSSGDVAEIEYYGRRNTGEEESRLTGTVTGFPEISGNDLHPYTHAMDGDPNTYFAKAKKTEGWIDCDFGTPVVITRIRFCPRTDTNFILQGDTYELCCWEKDHWVSYGHQTAENQWLDWSNVPAGGLYLLHNLSRGSEERIFTYADGMQIFW